jgi:hypothetical protein
LLPYSSALLTPLLDLLAACGALLRR